ncbi:MAG TPA: ABC transporter permease [Candidatus Acidoferrales bacterium]
MVNFLQDIKFGMRMLVKDRALTTVAVIALALGIGANTTVFTLVNAVLFRGLPFDEDHRIMHLSESNLPRNERNIGLSYPDFQDWRADSKTFVGLAGMTNFSVNLSDGGSPPERYNASRMTSNAFSLVGQKPVLGRDFLDEDDKPGANAVVVIGHGIWQNRYGGAADVIGKVVRINEAPTTIIGVMPEGFKFPTNADLWVPLIPEGSWTRRGVRGMSAFGKLAPGRTIEDARTELGVISKRLEAEYKETNEGVAPVIMTFNERFNGGEIRIVFLALLGAVGFVLLIACANVANLLLARSLSRAREISIRMALGAGRWRVIRQLLVESVLLGVMGGIAGLLIAIWGVRMFALAVANVNKPYWIVFTMDYTVFGYLAAICIGTGIIFGLIPALQASKVDFHEALKEGGRTAGGSKRTRWLSGSLVVIELALAVVLLVGAGLMIRSFLNLYGMQTVENAEQIMTMRLNLTEVKYPKPEDRLQFAERLLPRLQSVAGVDALGLSSNLPLSGSFGAQVEIEGAPPVESTQRPMAQYLVVSPGYPDVVGVQVLRGRGFDETDGTTGKQTAIVTQRFAERFWPNEDPLGKRFRLFRDNQPREWLTVVGISTNIRQNNPMEPENPVMFVPFRYQSPGFWNIVARTNVPPETVATALRREVQAIDEDLPVFQVRTLDQAFVEQRWPFRVFGSLFAVFAWIALGLSSVGIYAVMAYAVSQRTQEIGVRMALGASTGSIARLVMRGGFWQLGIGLLLGLAGAFGLSRVLAALLVGVQPTDPVTFLTICGLLLAAGLLACWIPARRAMRVDPVIALRYE